MDVTLIFLVSLSAILGIFIGYLIGKGKAQNTDQFSLTAELNAEREKNASLQQQLTNIHETEKAERFQLMTISTEKATLEANFKNIQEKLIEQKKEVTALQDQFALQFKNLANEIFEEKSKKFTDQNKLNIAELLNPLKEKITTFEKKVDETSKESIRWNSSLSEQVKNLKELNQQITKEAENLTKALKGDSKSQGNWGEIQLESILEKAGLQKDIHYFKERNFKDEDGSNQRPDYVVKLPDNKYLIIDAKVSLTAYTNFFNTTDDLEQLKFLKLHLDSINSHIKLLSDRNYQNIYGIDQPDYVLMFIANEPALTIALKEDQSIFEKALAKNIVLVSTSTLLATLRTISYIWKQDLQNKNAEEIARRAGDLYDKFEGFVQDLVSVGKSLNQTKINYEAAMNKLVEGKGNLVRRTEQLRELGAKTTKQLDQRILDRSAD